MTNPDYLISTPENVELHLELAGFGNRVVACLIDTVISWISVIVVTLIAVGLCLAMERAGFRGDQLRLLSIYFVSAAILIDFAILFGYFIYFEGLWQGQTPGKRFMQIRVVEQNGQPAGWASIFIRNLVRSVDEGICLIGLVFIMFDKKERRMGDFASGTLVIRERRRETITVEVTFPEAITLAQHFDAGRITSEEYQVVASFLGRRKQFTKGARQLLAHRLKEHLVGKVTDEEIKAKAPELLLEVVYLAYQGRA